MPLTRRRFVAGLGGAGLVYVLGLGCSRAPERRPSEEYSVVPKPNIPGVDFREWLLISPDGTVTVFTSRTEIGQGLTTVLCDLVCQGLELPRRRVRIVSGDTDLCPNDGPTTGSAATRYVAWEFWKACAEIRADLRRIAADRLGCSAEDLLYRQGEIVHASDAGKRLGIGELAEEGRVRRLGAVGSAAGQGTRHADRAYRDRGNLNVNGEAIVSGALQYTADLRPQGCLYGGLLVPPFHAHLTQLVDFEAAAARQVPGVVKVEKRLGTVVAVGRTFSAVRKALAAVEPQWQVPARPERLENEKEIRSGAVLAEVLEEKGRPERALRASDQAVEETYVTQYGSQVPMETTTAIGDHGEQRTTVRLGTQNPFFVRYGTAKRLKIPETQVHVVSLPAGGAFGSKTGRRVGLEAAVLSKLAGAPVKLVYTRQMQFQMQARYKESVIVDISSGVSSTGRLQARRVDIYQDEGFGTVGVYDIPNVETRLLKAPMPTRHATMRGTSYTQVVWAMESHTDTVARSIDMDPLEFRRLNVARPAFRPLLDACAEMIGYRQVELEPDHGIGFALCNHGHGQLGVAGAEVKVHRATGRVEVLRLCGAFDIGLVINRHTTSMGVKGAMIWGLGWALFEEARLDGHRSHVASLSDYRIPRFSDIPPIEIAFLDNHSPGSPQGCGEMPLVPTPPAICNAVFDAIGIRFHDLPLTPERVRAALRQA